MAAIFTFCRISLIEKCNSDRTMKDQREKEIERVFKYIHKYLEERGPKPRFHILNNQYSKVLKNSLNIKNHISDYRTAQLWSKCGRISSQGGKCHMIAMFAILYKKCPLQIWNIFVRQLQDTLILWTSRENKNILVYGAMESEAFDFNATPMAILEYKALALIDPEGRRVLQSHGADTYYVGRYPEHYILLEFWNTETNKYVKTETYTLFPLHYRVPQILEADQTSTAAKEVLVILKAKSSTTTKDKIKHAEHLTQISAITKDSKEIRMKDVRLLRVPAPYINATDAISPRVIKARKFAHQQQTRNNKTIQTTEATIRTGLRQLPCRASGQIFESQCNHVKM